MRDTISNNRSIDCGILQGSIIGPKLFILHINDICNISKIPKFTLFKDDTNIFYSNIDIDISHKQINNEPNRLHAWFNVSKLSLNISKTSYMMFSNSKSTQTFSISINCVNIRRVCAVKYLGVYIDDNLNWKRHITYVCNKLSKSISILYKACQTLNTNAIKTLYCSLILQYIYHIVQRFGVTHILLTYYLYFLSKGKLLELLIELNIFTTQKNCFII